MLIVKIVHECSAQKGPPGSARILYVTAWIVGKLYYILMTELPLFNTVIPKWYNL